MKLDLSRDWNDIRKFFRKTLLSNLHYAVATLRHGEAHVTPIGSVMLGEMGRGSFFETFTHSMGKAGEKIEILAVDSRKSFWLRSLFRGRFQTPPAMRLNCILGERRVPSEFEIGRWQKKVGLFKKTAGYQKLWGSLKFSRDFEVVEAETLEIGAMTSP